MRKTLFLLFTFIISISIVTVAKTYTTTDINVLPRNAKLFLKRHFKKSINHIEVDENKSRNAEYDVILSDGTEIEFNKDGNWQSIESDYKAIPSSVIPINIRNYISKYYRGRIIVEIELDKEGYEVTLNDGTELEFDRSGIFLEAD